MTIQHWKQGAGERKARAFVATKQGHTKIAHRAREVVMHGLLFGYIGTEWRVECRTKNLIFDRWIEVAAFNELGKRLR